MAGIYVHIPFCRKICHYCDFHKSASLEFREVMLASLKAEMVLRRQYLEGNEVETVYIGGGTPTVIPVSGLAGILEKIRDIFPVRPDAEISIEANPDDLSSAYLVRLRKAGFNRISIGVQSFHDTELKLLNRRHDSRAARKSITMAAGAGFSNISIDLIYGIPGSTGESWNFTLHSAVQAPVQHISSYHLSIEPRTHFYRMREKGRLLEVDENLSVRQYMTMVETLENVGFVHYEISSFGLPGFFSRHNTGYWNGTPYLGLGPSAHSYNGFSREWNKANNRDYIFQTGLGHVPSERELLSETDRFNDYIVTSLRTMWGADLEHIREHFGLPYYEHTKRVLGRYMGSGWLETEGSIIRLSLTGSFVSDRIISEFMMLFDE